MAQLQPSTKAAGLGLHHRFKVRARQCQIIKPGGAARQLHARRHKSGVDLMRRLKSILGLGKAAQIVQSIAPVEKGLHRRARQAGGLAIELGSGHKITGPAPGVALLDQLGHLGRRGRIRLAWARGRRIAPVL